MLKSIKKFFIYGLLFCLACFLVSFILFLFLEQPADPNLIDAKIGNGSSKEEILNTIVEAYPLDKSPSERVWDRYIRWLSGKDNTDRLSK